MGRFVEISIDNAAVADRAAHIAGMCPVDIFVANGRTLLTLPEREDECVLCGQCVTVAPDAIKVARAYGARRPVVIADRGSDG